MRSAVPAQTKGQGQTVRSAPVVLNVARIGDVIPLASNFNCIFSVSLGKTEQVVCKVIASEAAVKGECALCSGERVLGLLIHGPAEAHLDLVRAFGPGNV